MKIFLSLPPYNPRRLRLPTLQWISIPILILLPLLALLGVFGREKSLVRVSSGELELEVQYSSCLRYKQSNVLAITVTNISGRPLDQIFLECDSAYFSMYDNLTFLPNAQSPYIIPVGALAPGTYSRIRIAGEPEDKGSNTGFITVRSGNGKSATAVLKTFVFP